MTTTACGHRQPLEPAAPAANSPARRQVRHALSALATASPGRRHLIRSHAAAYLAQVDRRSLPIGYAQPIGHDRANRVDAYRMRGGAEFTRLLGIATVAHDERLPDTARAVIAAVDAPVDHLARIATATGYPVTVAMLHVAGVAVL